MLDLMVSASAALAAPILGWQGFIVGREYYLRRKRFLQAKEAAQRRGKPFLVIGRPGRRLRIYDGGDVTLDLDPRVLEDCPGSGVVGDVCRMPFEDKQFGAVLCSHVLDCVPTPADAEQAYQELHRVADEVFILSTHPHNLFWRWVSPEVTVWIQNRQGRFMPRAHPLLSLRHRLSRTPQRSH